MTAAVNLNFLNGNKIATLEWVLIFPVSQFFDQIFCFERNNFFQLELIQSLYRVCHGFRLRHLCTLEVSKFSLPNFGNFLRRHLASRVKSKDLY